MKRLFALALLVLVAVVWYVALPPRPRALAAMQDGLAEPVRGAFHIHTRRSDGTGTVDDVAAAASRAGLKFIILTDHGAGTQVPERPRYRQGVLCIDALEISTNGGHVIALDLPQAPYRLAGEPRDVLEDIARLKGFSIAAHPTSPKPELRWIEWTPTFDALEWINADSEWRDESPARLVRALFTYPLRRAESLAQLLDRPDTVLRRWDVLTGRRRVVALAGADAHARIGLRSLGEPYDNGPSLPLPSYEAVFRTFSIALPDVHLTGDAAKDARMVIDAIRAGHVYSSMDAVGGQGAMTFTAVSGTARASAGDLLRPSGPTSFRVDVRAPADARIVLKRNGEMVASGGVPTLEYLGRDLGAYRVEVELSGAPGDPPVPWIVSNPIYVAQPTPEATPKDPRGPATEFAVQYDNGFATDWDVENSPGSAGALDSVPAVGGGTELSFRYALSGTASAAAYVALVMPATPGISGYDRLMFRARANHPMRLSIQLREPTGELGERWRRSIYLDTQPRPVTVYFDEFTPAGFTSRRRPVLSNVQSVLFVIDTVNTDVGTNGQIWMDDVKYGR